MSDETRIQEVLDSLESHQTPEDVCGNDADLLREVRARWERMRRVNNQLDDLFPADAPTWKGGFASPCDNAELPQIEGYDVESVLGRGGMGVVFKAKHRKLNRFVALKMLLTGPFAGPLELARFQREAEAVAALRHPHIVQIHDVGEFSTHGGGGGGMGRRYFTMEFVEGGSLSQKLAGKPQAATEAAEIIATLACAVQFAHQSGFIHRDLKPANILLTADGVPKITDFGLARSIEAGPEFTLSGARVGTPSYMAPEQAQGKAHAIGPAVDVYALGAVLYEMLTGRPPFVGESAAATERQVIADEPVPPSRLNSRVPHDLETICLKCLQKNPARRYASAQDLADDLHRFLDGKPVLARPIGIMERTIKWARRRPTLATLCVLLTSAFGTGVWLVQQESSRQAETAQRQTKARQAIETGISQAYELAKAEQLPEARLLLDEPKKHLAHADSEDLRQRLAQAEAELAFAQQLADSREKAVSSVSEGLKVSEQEILERLARGHRSAFQMAGLDVDAEPATTAAQIRGSVLGNLIVTAVDEWALATFLLERRPEQRQLLHIARLADPDPVWRDSFRDPAVWSDTKKLRALARDASGRSPAPPAHQLAITAALLRHYGARSDAMILLQESVRRRPTDYWLNWEIAFAYYQDKKYKEASSYFRILVALRPHKAWAINRLGATLVLTHEFDEGIAYLRDALNLEANNKTLRHNLAIALIQAGRSGEGIAEAERLFQAEPTDAEAPFTFGTALLLVERREEAFAMFQKCIAINPRHFECQYQLATLLRANGRHEEAVLAYRKAVGLNREPILPHLGLAFALHDVGRYEEAVPELKWVIKELERQKKSDKTDIGDSLDKYRAAQHYCAESLLYLGRIADAQAAAEAYLAVPSPESETRTRMAHQRALCKHLLPLESQLPDILAGRTVLADPAKICAVAEWCVDYRRLPVTAARLYEDAFTKQPLLAIDLNAGHRFHAGCAAARAGSGTDAESAKLDDQARTALRTKALAWLRADLDAWTQRRKLVPNNDRPITVMVGWLQRSDLAGVRDEAALARLSEPERTSWQNLWDDAKTLAKGGAAQLLSQARAHVARQQWDKAAECYAQLRYVLPGDSDPWFEHAAVQLLAGNRAGYRQTCQDMLGRYQLGHKNIRAYLVARACTLAPESAADVVGASEVSAAELKKFAQDSWSLTELGALCVRSNNVKDAVPLFEKSLTAEKRPGAAVLNWLWLALAHHKLGNADEAGFWLHKAGAWLDSVGLELPANAGSFALTRHNWLEAQILRREAESLISAPKEK